MAGHERWVIDGTFQRRIGDFVTSRLDLIVWLDLPLAMVLVRLLRRSLRRVLLRKALWNGNVETWRDAFFGRDSVLVGAVRRHRRDRRTPPQHTLRLRSPAEIARWLATLGSQANLDAGPSANDHLSRASSR